MENPVRTTTIKVVRRAKEVKINQEKIHELAEKLIKERIPLWPKKYHLRTKNQQKMLDYLILLDSLNFCFWNKKQKWQIKYKGKKKIKNLMIYEVIPKEFATTSDEVNVTADGARIEVVEKDPSYLIVYDEITPDEEVTISYSVDGYKSSKNLDRMSTELYAEELLEVTEEKPEEICTPGEKRCSGDILEECSEDGKSWNKVESCSYGCNPETLTCREKPSPSPVPAPMPQPIAVPSSWATGIIIAIIIAIITVISVIYLKMR